MSHRHTGTWVRISTDKYVQIRHVVEPMGVVQESFFPGGGYYGGWRLLFKGQPVAVWYAAMTGNTVEARVR